MGQWMLNLLDVVRNPRQIECMSYERMRWWNRLARKIIDRDVRAAGGKPDAEEHVISKSDARRIVREALARRA